MQYGTSFYDTKNKAETSLKILSKESLLDTERQKIEGDDVYCNNDSHDLL